MNALFAVLAVLAADRSPPPATLHEAVDAAMAQSGETADRSALQVQARALRRLGEQPFAGPPVLGGDVIPGPDGVIEAEATVSAGLRWPGEARAVRDYAGEFEAASRSGLDAARLRVAGEVREAWWALAAARAALAVDQDQVLLASRLAEETQRLVAAGESARRDLLLVQAEASAARARLSDAEGEAARAEAAYVALSGPAPTRFPAEAASQPSEPDANPTLRSALARADAARARARTLDYAANPRLEATLGVRRERDGRDDLRTGLQPEVDAVLVGVKIPLGRDPSAAADAAGARAEALAASAEASRLRLRLEAEARSAQMRLGASQRALEAARTQHQQLADALTLTERGRSEGQIGFVEALRARQSLADAERTLAAAEIAALAAVSTYNQALGLAP